MRFLVGFCSILLLLLNIQYTVCQISIPLEKQSYDPRAISSLRNRAVSRKNNKSPARASLMNAYVNIQERLSFNYPLYIGNVKIGSQNETFSVVFDTGSDILWMPASDCDGCGSSRTFDCSDSTTCSASSNYESRTYGTGDIGGYDVTDNVKIGEVSVNYQFISVLEAGDLGGLPSNGLMGLNNDDSEQNFVDLAYAGGYIVDKVYSFNLAKENSTANSTLNIGFIPTAYVNTVAWLPATDSNYWSTDVLAMTVNDQNIPFGDDSDITSVLFDSGTSDILIADPVYKVVSQLLEDQNCVIGDYCDCSTQAMANYPNITFTTRGANFTITPQQYMLPPPFDYGTTTSCIAALGNTYLPDVGESAGRQILGVPFLISNFVTFSKRNQSMGIDAEIMTLLTPMNNIIYFWSAIAVVALMFIALVLIQILQSRFKPKAVEQDVVSVVY